jgi:hypothetical protein
MNAKGRWGGKGELEKWRWGEREMDKKKQDKCALDT